MKSKRFFFLLILCSGMIFAVNYDNAPCNIGAEAKKAEKIILGETGQLYGPFLSQLVNQILESGGMDIPTFKSFMNQQEAAFQSKGLNVEKSFQAMNNLNTLVVNCKEYVPWLVKEVENEKKNAELAMSEPKENVQKILKQLIYYDEPTDSYLFINHPNEILIQAKKMEIEIDGQPVKKREQTELEILNKVKPDETEWDGSVTIKFKYYREKRFVGALNWDISETWENQKTNENSESVDDEVLKGPNSMIAQAFRQIPRKRVDLNDPNLDFDAINGVSWSTWMENHKIACHLIKIKGEWQIKVFKYNSIPMKLSWDWKKINIE